MHAQIILQCFTRREILTKSMVLEMKVKCFIILGIIGTEKDTLVMTRRKILTNSMEREM